MNTRGRRRTGAANARDRKRSTARSAPGSARIAYRRATSSTRRPWRRSFPQPLSGRRALREMEHEGAGGNSAMASPHVSHHRPRTSLPKSTNCEWCSPCSPVHIWQCPIDKGFVDNLADAARLPFPGVPACAGLADVQRGPDYTEVTESTRNRFMCEIQLSLFFQASRMWLIKLPADALEADHRRGTAAR